MRDQTYAFVDIETTGSSAQHGRITEVAIILMRDHKVIDTFQTLVNPEAAIPSFITKVTGIDDTMVANAPVFADVAEAVWKKLDGCIFVAHNVRFDYEFLKQEFIRLEKAFQAEQLCTVKLSRQLYPEHSRHGLDALIERFDLNVENRHRALDDCQLMIDLWQLWHKFDSEKLMKAVVQQLQGPILPKNLARAQVENLPQTPGVYYFYAEGASKPLYVGKGRDIKRRVLRHFSGEHLSERQAVMIEQISHIDFHQTTGALGALLHEYEEIKQLAPDYNRRVTASNNLYTLYLNTNNERHSVEIREVEAASLLVEPNFYGGFSRQQEAEKALSSFALNEEASVLKHNFELQQFLIKHQLKNWWFGGPIMIKEYCPEQERSQGHVFDQWSYLGTLEVAADCLSAAAISAPRFDLNYYRLLRRFLRQKLKSNTELIQLNSIEDLKHFEL